MGGASVAPKCRTSRQNPSLLDFFTRYRLVTDHHRLANSPALRWSFEVPPTHWPVVSSSRAAQVLVRDCCRCSIGCCLCCHYDCADIARRDCFHPCRRFAAHHRNARWYRSRRRRIRLEGFSLISAASKVFQPKISCPNDSDVELVARTRFFFPGTPQILVPPAAFLMAVTGFGFFLALVFTKTKQPVLGTMMAHFTFNLGLAIGALDLAPFCGGVSPRCLESWQFGALFAWEDLRLH